jgi:hypothetical protein
MSAEPHISDVADGNAVVCRACGTANVKDSAYCRECGRRLSAAKVPADGESGDVAAAMRQGAFLPDRICGGVGHAERGDETTPSSPAERRKHLLEKLDMMERELEAGKQEAFPEPERKNHVDKLDEHEETLKNIAFRLDALISDLLKAEAQEYSFSDLTRVDGDSFVKRSAAAKIDRLGIKGKNAYETIIMIAMIAAVFMAGVIFGIWGAHFLGIP